MLILYDIFYSIFFLLYLPYLLVKGKWHGDFMTRFGFFPQDVRQRLGAGGNLWFHAVSVGEVMAVTGLLRAVGGDFPGEQIVLSTVTPTGYRLAKSRLGERCLVVYAPLDFSFAVRRYVALIRPRAYITAETEIWPNLFRTLIRGRIPVLLVNGRISDRSFGKYRKIRFLLRDVFAAVGAFCMQTPADAAKVAALGARAGNIFVVGNMKFDLDRALKQYSPADIGLSGNERLWIAGSTHPGEEEIVLEDYGFLLKEFPDLRLILAPRHVERAPEIAGMARERGYGPLLFSQQGSRPFNVGEVLIVDTIGDLRSLYRLADVVFMGKSLTGQGGQNILEPASFAKPVVVGPHMQNFQRIMELLLEKEGIVRIERPGKLRSAVAELLRSPQRAGAIGERALRVIESHQGATKKIKDILLPFLTRSSV